MTAAAQPPLVSLVALAYNSASTLIETLESLRAQDHPRIELVLCDDASTDDTLQVASRWLAENPAAFERVLIVNHPVNVGIVRNLADGLARAQGEWLKPLACDDLLVPDALSCFVAEARARNADWLFSQCARFETRNGRTEELGELVRPESVSRIECLPTPELERAVATINLLPAPGAFYSRAFLDRVGGLDLRLRNLDDWPLWLRALSTGARPAWIPRALVRYRISVSAVTNLADTRLVKPALFADELLLTRLYRRGRMTRSSYWDLRIQQLRQWIVLRWMGNRRAAVRWTAPLALLSPVAWKRAIGRTDAEQRA